MAQHGQGGTAPAAEAPRDRSLDAFRALFIAAVIVFHYLARWAPPRNPVDLYGYSYDYSRYLELGKFGVHAFFLISGLFITVTLLRSRDAIEFAYKRVYRIYPAFLIAATVTFVVVRLCGPDALKVGPKAYALTLTLLGTDLSKRVVDGAYWSLAVEAKFYFWTALAFVALRGRFWAGLIGLALTGAVVDRFSPSVGSHVLIGPYMPLFLAGMALAYQHVRRETRTALALAAAAIVTYACNADFYALHDGETFWPNVVILASVAMVVGCTLGRVRIDHPVLVYLGLISYEIYLVHQNLGVTLIAQMKTRLGVPDMVAFASAVAMSVALAALLNRWGQRPVQWAMRRAWERWRGGLPPRPVSE